MKRGIETLQEESLKLSLDEQERQAMRDSLLAYIEKNPVRDGATPQSVKHKDAGLQKKLNSIFAFVIICLIIVIGVVYMLK
ncbi:MAG: hypothetical protein M3Q73_02960 [bacterium]|nr:hypothetical protein [bacterium]